MTDLLKKSAAAALLIALGDYVLLKLGNPLGPFLFALGLLGVCYLGTNLFTGKCGFLFEDKLDPLDLIIILLANLLAGWLFGLFFSLLDPEVASAAAGKVASWDFSFTFFGKSLLCGVVMYVAVKMYKASTPLGILFGIPLFIFCGFQHCIANVITLGVAANFSWSLILAILGNFLGSLATSFLVASLPAKTTPAAKKPSKH